MTDNLELLINTLVVFLIVVDPVGLAAMFTTLAHSNDPRYLRRMAARGTLLATGMLLVFFFLGDLLLKSLGIGLPAFRVAGGLLLFLLSIDMVFARQSGLRSTTYSEQEEAEHKQDISVFPLAFPLIAGPGALTTVLLMSSSADDFNLSVGMIAIIFLVCLLTYLALIFAPLLMRLIGETGANVVSRLFGLVLSALAVQYVLDGIRSWLQQAG